MDFEISVDHRDNKRKLKGKKVLKSCQRTKKHPWNMSVRVIPIGAVDKAFGWKVLLNEIIWRLQVQSQQQVRITRNTYYNLTHVPGYG